MILLEVVLAAGTEDGDEDVDEDGQSNQVFSPLEVVLELVVSAGLLLLVVWTAVELLVVLVLIFTGVELELAVLVRASVEDVVEPAALLEVELLVDSAGLIDVVDALEVE